MATLKASAASGDVKREDTVTITIRGARLIDFVGKFTGAENLMTLEHDGRQYYLSVSSANVTVESDAHAAVTGRKCSCGWEVDRAVAPKHFEREMALHFAAMAVTS